MHNNQLIISSLYVTIVSYHDCSSSLSYAAQGESRLSKGHSALQKPLVKKTAVERCAYHLIMGCILHEGSLSDIWRWYRGCPGGTRQIVKSLSPLHSKSSDSPVVQIMVNSLRVMHSWLHGLFEAHAIALLNVGSLLVHVASVVV